MSDNRCKSTVALGEGVIFRCDWQADHYHTLHSHAFLNVPGQRKAARVVWETAEPGPCFKTYRIGDRVVECKLREGHEGQHVGPVVSGLPLAELRWPL